MTPSGIEPATFRFVAQHLNHCATAVPPFILYCNKLNATLSVSSGVNFHSFEMTFVQNSE